MSETIETKNVSDWSLGDIEPQIAGLRATIGIMGHMIQSPNEIDNAEWCKIEDELAAHTKRIEALWEQAWNRNKAKEVEHEAEIAALEAEVKAAAGPLTGARLEELQAVESMLRAMATVITTTLDGKPVGLLTALREVSKPKPEPEPEPQPERMRW